MRTVVKIVSFLVPLGMFLAIPLLDIAFSNLLLAYVMVYVVIGIVLFEAARRIG